MIKKLLYRILWVFAKHTRIHSINKNLKKNNLIKILSDKKYTNEKKLTKFGFKVYSQSDEDGIIEEIFNRINTKNKKFIEIGVQDGLETNTTYLLNKGWSGLWIEANDKDVKKINDIFNFLIKKNILSISNNFIDSNNINKILSKNYDSKEEIDLLSIDIGLQTYEVLKNIDHINPRVIVVEYNAKFRPDIMWVAKNLKKNFWDNTDHFGASLKSYQIMCEKKGYKLVGCGILGINAFFVRNDLINDKFLNNFETKEHYEEPKYWLLKAYEHDLKITFKEFENK